jgi:TfoX/Sxy family transcriptional regulator of competence genes
MAFNEELAERIRHGLVRKKGIEERKMFGGIGFLLHGNMLVGVWKDSPLVRLGPEQSDEALKEAHVSELKNPWPGHDEGMGTVRPGGYRGRRPVEGLD